MQEHSRNGNHEAKTQRQEMRPISSRVGNDICNRCTYVCMLVLFGNNCLTNIGAQKKNN